MASGHFTGKKTLRKNFPITHRVKKLFSVKICWNSLSVREYYDPDTLSTLWLFLSLPVTRVMHLTSRFALQIVRSTAAWNSSKYCSKESWKECFYFPRHDTWAYRGKRGNRFTHSAGDGREWLVHAPATLPSWKSSGTHWIGCWVDHRAGTEFGRWAQGRKHLSKITFRRFRETINFMCFSL